MEENDNTKKFMDKDTPFFVNLEPDVAEMFPDAQSVNEALRFLIRIVKEHIGELPIK